MPTVSVCIPTFNPKPEHLRAALESVFNQSFQDFEVIIHDDASDFDVEEIIRPFLKDERITLRRSKTSLGIGANWNAAAKHARGTYIAYLFQDDMWNPKYLERCVQILLEHPNVGFTAANHGYAVEDETGAAATGIYKEVETLRNALREGAIDREQFLTWWIEHGLRPNLIGEPSFVVMRKQLMESAGPFNEKMKQGLDVDMWVRCLLHADGYWIEESLGTFRVHDQGASARNEKRGAGMTDRLRIYRSLIKRLPNGEMKSLAKKSAGKQLWKLGHRVLARKTSNPHLQFLRYFFVGGFASVVDFGTYAGLSSFAGLNYYLAAFFGYTFGFAVNHFLSVLWVFESKMERKKEVMLSYAIAIGGLLWTELLLWIFLETLSMNHLIARFTAMWIVLTWNFGMRKLFVFK